MRESRETRRVGVKEIHLVEEAERSGCWEQPREVPARAGGEVCLDGAKGARKHWDTMG